jgi:hypothetical protein
MSCTAKNLNRVNVELTRTDISQLRGGKAQLTRPLTCQPCQSRVNSTQTPLDLRNINRVNPCQFVRPSVSQPGGL